MTSVLRRSRRAVPVKVSTYNVGDIVEINRNNTVLKGKLAYNLTEGPSSSNPLWLVKFDNYQKEEEVYETYFGKVFKSEVDKTMPPPSNRRPARGASSSEGEQPKRVTFSDRSTTTSDDSSGSLDNNAKRVSAREQRSRRRQAKIETDPPVDGTNHRKRSHHAHEQPNKKMRGNEEVVVVKLLTGTLYLYRGAHRRAEFVRGV